MIDRSFAAIFKARKCIDVDGNLFLDEKMILRKQDFHTFFFVFQPKFN